MSSGSPAEVVQRYLDALGRQAWDALPDLYAPDAVVEHPFNPPASRWLRGRPALRAHFASLRDMGLRLRPTNVLVHETLDPEVVVTEFGYRGVNTSSGRPVSRRNVFVTTVRDGLIVASRDYQADST